MAAFDLVIARTSRFWLGPYQRIGVDPERVMDRLA
jgi:hypothetical protein